MDEYEMHGFMHEKSMLVGNPLFYRGLSFMQVKLFLK